MLTSSVWGFSASVPICDTASSYITKSLKQVNIVNEQKLSLNSCQNQVHLYIQKRLIKRQKKNHLTNLGKHKLLSVSESWPLGFAGGCSTPHLVQDLL